MDKELAALAEKVRNADTRARLSMSHALNAALDAGDALIAARRLVAHGGWADWLDQHCHPRRAEAPYSEALIRTASAEDQKLGAREAHDGSEIGPIDQSTWRGHGGARSNQTHIEDARSQPSRHRTGDLNPFGVEKCTRRLSQRKS